MSTIELIKQKLASLNPEKIEIIDESTKHKDHEGAKTGGGHFVLTIVSYVFSNKSI